MPMCCVVGCSKHPGNSKGTTFYRFPKVAHKSKQKELWIAAVKRKNPDGSPWQPSLSSIICSGHFIGNAKSENPLSPSFIPTIFPMAYKQRKMTPEAMQQSEKRGAPTEENFSLKDCSFVKHETVVIKTEEDDTFHEMTESKFNERDIKEEYFNGWECIAHEAIDIKTEDQEDDQSDNQEEDQSNNNNCNEGETKGEYFDVLESTIHEDIVTKTEDQEKDQSNSKYFDWVYEESRRTFKCRYCYTGLSTQKYKTSHEGRCKFRPKKEHLGGSVFECSFCKLLYTREEDKNKHQAVCKKRKKSKKCKENTTRKYERKYCCDKCSYETKLKKHLVCHIRIHDKVNGPKYCCNQCIYQTIDKSTLNRHLRTHHCYGLICIVCQKSFKHKTSLDGHYVSRHPDRSDKWGSTITNKIKKCPKCRYQTVRTSDLKCHLVTHGIQTDQAQFKCYICEYKFIRRCDLAYHLRLHIGQLPFVCTECDKRFNTKRHLDSHIISRHLYNEELVSSVSSTIYRCEKCNLKTLITTYFKSHLKTCL